MGKGKDYCNKMANTLSVILILCCIWRKTEGSQWVHQLFCPSCVRLHQWSLFLKNYSGLLVRYFLTTSLSSLLFESVYSKIKWHGQDSERFLKLKICINSSTWNIHSFICGLNTQGCTTKVIMGINMYCGQIKIFRRNVTQFLLNIGVAAIRARYIWQEINEPSTASLLQIRWSKRMPWMIPKWLAPFPLSDCFKKTSLKNSMTPTYRWLDQYLHRTER